MAFSSSRKEIQLKPQIEVPLGPLPLDIPRVKAVSFNDDVVETSIGGTRTVARMKLEPLASIAINRNTSVQFESSLSQKTTGCISSVATISPVSETKNSITEMENKENMENSEETKTSKNKPQSQKANNGKDVSPMGRQTKAVPLLKEFEKFTPDIVRRTTQEYLDQVPDAFVTPPQYQMRRHTLETKIFETPDCYRAVQMETPHKLSMFDLVSGTDDSITEEADGEDSCSVTVAVRVRPYSQREMSDVNVKRVVSMSGNETTVTTESGNVHRFAFDFSFWSFDRVSGEFADQGHIYTSLAQPLLGKAFEGYNTCLFAYGQTGSGKSYSIMGHGQDTGIIPRFCAELFSRAARASSKDKVKISVEISFFEIYNEKIHDLLASCKEKNGKKATLKVREHPVLGPYVEGLSTFVVNSFEDVEGWITLGTKNRATAATGMNDKSSRSHSVFTIVLTQTKTERVENKDHDHSITSKINLVDLAGSERQSQAQTTGERLREGANINKSLLTLGKVISLLAERSASSKKRKIFIPYRDSVLTWLLKESLGGNSKTAMIATISPSHHHVEETLSTLRYARQTRSIVNVVRINEDPKAKIIRELRAEIEKLRSQSGTMNDDAHMAGLAEVAMLREKLMSKEKEMDELCKSWQERLRQAETRKQEESKKLEKSGVAAVKVDNQQPNLVNLNEDPQLSELLLYVIKPGQTRVGRKQENSVHDIQLSGALIADNHCIINNVEGIVNITPIGVAPIYVNGNLVSEPTILHHADRVILGGDHYFRFNHPMEVKTTKRKHGTASLEAKDFEFARQELLQTQEAKLQAELEEAQKVAQAKMEEELERARRKAEFELSQQRSGYEDKLADLEKTLKQQGLEVQKAVESKQEASSLIAELRRQKLVLEQEILASRKRHQLEAEAAEKINLNPDGIKSRILELLQNERTRVAVQLEKAQQHRDEIVTSSSIRLRQQGAEGLSGKAALKRKDLCKVALLLREANKISHFLKKNLVFSREDVEDESSEAESNGLQILIKVTNTQHRIFTHWTVAKLEEKIIQMRDLYQNDGDIPAEDDEVFNDPEDSWEKENLSPCNSPTSSGVFRRSPISSIASHSTHTSSSFVSPALKRVSFGSPSRADRDVSTYRVCRKMALSVMDQLNALCFEETVVDKILWDCYVLKSSVSSLLVEPGNSSCVSGTKQLSCSPIQLVYGLHRLATHCSLWAESFDQDSPTMHSQLTEHIRSIGIHVSHLLQGYETDLSSLVQESAGKLSEEVLSLCRTCGQLSLVTKTRVLRLEQFNQDSAASQPSPEVCRAFLAGCDKLLDHTLEDGIQSVQHSETQAKSLSETLTSSQEMSEVCQDVSQTVFCTKALLRSCQEVQVEVDASLTEVSSLSSDLQHHCHASYCRLQALLALISSLAEAAHLLVQCTEPVIKGNNQDLQGIHSCAEMIHRKSLLLLNCSCSSINSLSPDSLLDPSHISSQFWPRNSTFDDSLHKSGDNALNTGSSFMLTDSQVEHLNFATQEVLSASQSLMNRIKKLMGTDCTSTIPASKRRMFSVSSGK